MPKQDKAKPPSSKNRNDTRQNGKAFKKNGRRPGHTRTKLSESDKVGLGGGLLHNVKRRWAIPNA